MYCPPTSRMAVSIEVLRLSHLCSFLLTIDILIFLRVAPINAADVLCL